MWTARDRITGSICVLKLAPAGTTGGERLLREAALLAELSHPRLVPCVDRFSELQGFGDGPSAGFAMPWLDAARLDEATERLDLPGRLAIFAGVLDAVGYLHERGVLHLDLKPTNVLVGDDGPVLLDLGTAQRIDDANPGTGGTLGYAAPEVLDRQLPSVRADLYGLGAILYLLLTGRRPFQAASPGELKREVLRGDLIPVRAVAPEVPRPLAQLTQALLARSPLDRPESAREVFDALAGLGHPLPTRLRGAPPLVGRERELEDLIEVLAEDASPVAVLGEPGLGRDRLVRAALARLPHAVEGRTLDVSRVPRPLEAVRAALDGRSPQGAAPDANRMAQPTSRGGRIYVGREEDLAPEVRAGLLALQPALARADIGLVWVGRQCPPGARPFPVGPLPIADARRLAVVLGVPPGGPARRAAEEAHGRPGLLLRVVNRGRVTLTPETEARYRGLQALPAGAPRGLFRHLDPAWTAALEELEAAGLVRWRVDGALIVEGADPTAEIDPSLREVLARMLDADAVPPVFRAVLAYRFGRSGLAAPVVDEVLASPGAPTPELAELLEHAAREGRVPAAVALSRLRRADGDVRGALQALDLAPHPSHLAERVELMRTSSPVEEAQAIIDAHQGPMDAAARVEAARVALEVDRVEEAADHLAHAEALGVAPHAALPVRIGLVEHQPSDPAARVAQIEALLAPHALEALPWWPLFGAGRVLLRAGQPSRAIELMNLAVAAADRAGDIPAASMTRLTLGNALLSAGKGRLARRMYSEALYAARALGLDEVMIRAVYSLCELELRTGRLDAAQRALRDFLATARRFEGKEVHRRGALLQAGVALLLGRPEEVEELLVPWIDDDGPPDVMQHAIGQLRAEALLALGRPEEALDALDRNGPVPATRSFQMNHHALAGRCHVAIGRRHLGVARGHVPNDVEPLDRLAMGRILLAAAGEDLEPTSFEGRRRDLDRAAGMLRGDEASRAATLRDRMLSAPGAGLTAIVDLLETVGDPRIFPKTLARIVGEALGANRVLILMRIPGLGRQLGFIELGQREAAGISEEVMRRVVRADDVWLAGDAFSDPAIREVSATVRSFEIRSVLAVAIPRGDQAVGALYVDDLHRSNRFTSDDVAVMKRLASAASHLIGMLVPGARPSTALEEPQDLLGVLLSDARQVQEMQLAFEMLENHRNKPVNLLITGATGTGKTWLARRITRDVLGLSADPIEHAMRETDPDKLVTALAGTRRGEFTGAIEKEGAIRKALHARTSLFLDEVQALDDRGQTTLLPLLELPERRFSGLTGAAGRISQPLCVILGTNVDVSAGRWRQHFRQDLWFRMSQIHIHLPTLAERGPEVVYRYLSDHLRKEDLDVAPEEVLEPAALQFAVGWSWPGNLRELASAAQEIAFRYRREGRPLTRADLATLRAFRPQEHDDAGPPAPGPAARSPFVQQVLRILPRYGWNQSEVARALGCSVSKVNRALKAEGMLEEVRIQRARVPGG